MLTICVEEDWVLDGKKVVLLKPVEEVGVSELTKELARLSSENKELREENKKLKNKTNINFELKTDKLFEEIKKEIKKENLLKERKKLKELYSKRTKDSLTPHEWERLADAFDVKRSKNEDYSDWTERIKFAMYG